METGTVTMTAISVLNLTPSTKEQVASFADQIINEVVCGNENPLALHLKIKALEASLKLIADAIKVDVLTEAEKHGQKSFDHLGCKIEIKELGTKFDFTKCGDPKWEQAQSAVSAAETLRKEREAFLKGIKGHETIVDEATGEVKEIYPPIKTSTTGIAVTLK